MKVVGETSIDLPRVLAETEEPLVDIGTADREGERIPSRHEYDDRRRDEEPECNHRRDNDDRPSCRDRTASKEQRRDGGRRKQDARARTQLIQHPLLLLQSTQSRFIGKSFKVANHTNKCSISSGWTTPVA